MNTILNYIKQTLELCMVEVRIIKEDEDIDHVDFNLRDEILENTKGIRLLPVEVSYTSAYEISDALDINWLALPMEEDHSFLLAGPYLTARIDVPLITGTLEKLNVDRDKSWQIIQFLYGLPVLNDPVLLHHMTQVYLRSTFGMNNIEKVSHGVEIPSHFSQKTIKDNKQTAESIRKRYTMEDEMVNAIRNGDEDTARNIINGSRWNEEIRTANSLRNDKNYAVIMHTLVRKAIQQAGVDPVLIDMISRSYAVQIEQAQSRSALIKIRESLLHDYCSMVREFRTSGTSPVIARAIGYISTHMNEVVTLDATAEKIGASKYYLSARFRAETGIGFTDYVQKLKIRYAMDLLGSSSASMEEIALECGFSSASYFARVFRSLMGMTPSEYRKKQRD